MKWERFIEALRNGTLALSYTGVAAEPSANAPAAENAKKAAPRMRALLITKSPWSCCAVAPRHSTRAYAS
jgi:hypothetical protein